MSKAAWGGLRLGWIRANPRLVRELAAVRADVDMASPVLEQLLALELLARWEEVVDSRVALLRERRDALLDALAEHAPAWTVRRPERRAERVGAPPLPRRDAARVGRRARGPDRHARARRSASTARSSATCGCRSRRRPTCCATRSARWRRSPRGSGADVEPPAEPPGPAV